jgi:murein DD-endopeptidase MepM/ murein hydrolase activator NlpD
MDTSSSRPAKNIGRSAFFFVLAFAVVATAVAGLLFFEMERPAISIDKEIKFLGGKMELPVRAADIKSGIRQIAIVLVQNGAVLPLFDRQYSRQSWFPRKAGAKEVKENVAMDAKAAGAKDGAAELVVTAKDFSLKGNTAELRLPVTVDMVPPRVTVEHTQLYVQQGGSGMILYRLSEPAARHGVLIDKNFFPGYPLQDGRCIAYIALPWNCAKPEKTQVTAADAAGNEGSASFALNFKKRPEKKDRIEISDGFLKNKIPEFQAAYPELKGTDLEKYLQVNQGIRKQNAEKIAEVCRNTAAGQLWQDRFLRMPGAGRAGFADQRSYFYQGQEIDQQTHLGIDIASTERAEIRAANRGRVILADYLGIYGNTVILDHGQGVSSLYSHLSQIGTSVGKMVEKDELIGRSGTSGMAGGDHLHFSMLVHGIFVTPIEWWDQHWIDVNIKHVLDAKSAAQDSTGQSKPAENNAP